MLEYGALLLVGLTAAIGLVAYIALLKPDKVMAETPQRLPVIRSMDTSGEDGFEASFILKTPDETLVRVTTTSLALAQTVVDTACVLRLDRASGRVSWRLAPPHRCPVS
ncbi:hypothetical protein ATO11_02855 [Pseudaestuariivita atlantica]|uniref:Uncharacterized protein n=1 Tax=Pseudaestuariivita atlantica TaxID=1317121 RepID=A0A0L1JV31_9RHOB|nr:hypothetical protein ATO11_02855 [Pseudaestuariivita atlantica]